MGTLPATHTTTHSARAIILLGCLAAFIGLFLPWNAPKPASLAYAFGAIFLTSASITMMVRLTWRWGIWAILVGFLVSAFMISVRSQVETPGPGLYFIPAGAALLMVGGLMVLAYPARRQEGANLAPPPSAEPSPSA
jgi:hypothetical protein